MPARKAANAADATDVFINCPFDDSYDPILRGIVFAIYACSYRPRCALEENDSGDLRFDRLCAIIAACDFAVHDLSRTDLSGEAQAPRFNMPFELGLYLGAKRFGGPRQKRKRTLILAESRARWAPSISDLAGLDPVFHNDKPERAIRAVRDFLYATPEAKRLPGETALLADYAHFQRDLPALARAARQTLAEAQRYSNYVTFVAEYLLER
jgi:hypothetical protein